MGAELSRTFKNVVNIDISTVLIEKMSSQYSELANVRWLVMDITDLQFPDSSFDVVLDKGTLDSLFCGGNSMEVIDQSLVEIHRVLRKGGHFISITYGQPPSRVPVFQGAELGWKMSEPLMIENRTKSARHWIYRFRKSTDGGRGSRG
jgi:ubiquinone/menaquinone biosynthesis C-methylase UbiE